MNINEIADNVKNLNNAWQVFKDTNDQKLAALQKQKYEPLYDEQLSKIAKSIDHYKERLDKIEVSMQRPQSTGGLHQSDHHSQYFKSYISKGLSEGLSSYEQNYLSTSTQAEGGYLVTPHISKQIIQALIEKSPIRKLASSEVISTDSLDVIEDLNFAGAGWAQETQERLVTEAPILGRKKIRVHELYAQPKATQKLIDDANIDIEKWLISKIVEVFSVKENASFINGDGENKPRGILTYASGKEWGQIEQIESSLKSNISADDLIYLFYSLKESYASNASFIMNRSLMQQIRTLKDSSTGLYLWNPGLVAANPATILGLPVIQVNEMPIAAENSLSIAIADFKAAYKIVDRTGIRILRDPFTDKPFIKFYTTKRVGGDVVNFDAIKIMKLGA